MSNLAQTYSALGRHKDALDMNEEALKFHCRVQPKNHPHISESNVPYVIVHVLTIVIDFVHFQSRLWEILR
jgi:hypothetical protein